MDVIANSERDERRRVSALISQFNSIQQSNEPSTKSSSFRIPNKIPKVDTGNKDVARSQSMSHHESSASETNGVNDLHLKWLKKTPNSALSEEGAKDNGVRRSTSNTKLPLEKTPKTDYAPEVVPKSGFVINTRKDLGISSKRDTNLSAQSVTSGESSAVTFRTITPWSQMRNTIDNSYIARSTPAHSSAKDDGPASVTASRGSLNGTSIDADRRWKKNHLVKMVKQASLERTSATSFNPTSVTPERDTNPENSTIKSDTTKHARARKSQPVMTSAACFSSRDASSIHVGGPTQYSSYTSDGDRPQDIAAPTPKVPKAAPEPHKSLSLQTHNGSVEPHKFVSSVVSGVGPTTGETVTSQKVYVFGERKPPSLTKPLGFSIGDQNKQPFDQAKQPVVIEASQTKTFILTDGCQVKILLSKAGDQAMKPESITPGQIMPQCSIIGNKTIKPSDLLTSDNKIQPSNILTGDQTKPSNILTGDQTKPSNILTGDQTKPSNNLTNDQIKPSNILTGDQTKPSNSLTSDKIKPSNILTGDQIKPSNILTSDKTKPSIILTGDQTKPSNILTGDQTKPSNILTGDQTNSIDSFKKIKLQPSKFKTSDFIKQLSSPSDCQTKRTIFRNEYKTNTLNGKTQEALKLFNGVKGAQIMPHQFLNEAKTKPLNCIDGQESQEDLFVRDQERQSPYKMEVEVRPQTSQGDTDGVSSHDYDIRAVLIGHDARVESIPKTRNSNEDVTLRPKATSMRCLNSKMLVDNGHETLGNITARQERAKIQRTGITVPDKSYADETVPSDVQDMHTTKLDYGSATERINRSLVTLKTELMSMHEQDLILLKQLINISQNIQKLQRSRVLRVSKSLSFSSGLLHPQPLHLQKRSLSSSLVRQNSAPFNMEKRRQLYSLMRSSTEQLSDGSLSSFDESEFDSQSEMDESSPSLTSSYPYLSPKSNRARPVFQYCSSQMSLCVNVAEDPDQTYEDILKRNVRLWKMSLHGQAPVIQEITCLL